MINCIKSFFTGPSRADLDMAKMELYRSQEQVKEKLNGAPTLIRLKKISKSLKAAADGLDSGGNLDPGK